MGPDVDVDPSGLTATVAVTTSIDAVCAVSYGVDEPAGSLATDQDMAAGGHRESGRRGMMATTRISPSISAGRSR
jgi:hypothetical protein